MSGRGMNGDVMSGGGRNRRGGSKSRLLSPPPSGTGNTNTSSAVSSQMLQDNSIPKVRGSSAERLLSPPPVTSPGAVNGHHGKVPVDLTNWVFLVTANFPVILEYVPTHNLP